MGWQHPGVLLETQALMLNPDLLNQNLPLNKIL